MDCDTLKTILKGFDRVRVAVIGDFGVDRYWFVDPELRDVSRETGLPVRHVVDARVEPGGAGTVVKQLHGLNVGEVAPVGLLGDDPEAMYLRRCFSEMGFEPSGLLDLPGRLTPSFTKILDSPGRLEADRFDLFERSALEPEDEERLIRVIGETVPGCDAAVVSDYTDFARPGVMTPRVCEAVSDLGKRLPELPIIVDSRRNATWFANVHLKVNEPEFLAMAGCDGDARRSVEDLGRLGCLEAGSGGRTLFVTLGERGMLVCGPAAWTHVRGFTVEGEIDIVGAGDAALAALAACLGSGVDAESAALIGVLVSSLTIEQLCTTGVATPSQVVGRLGEYTSSRGRAGSDGG